MRKSGNSASTRAVASMPASHSIEARDGDRLGAAHETGGDRGVDADVPERAAAHVGAVADVARIGVVEAEGALHLPQAADGAVGDRSRARSH